MTTEIPRGELSGPEEPPSGSRPSQSVPVIVGACDRVLREVGRRGHLFSWLRAPGAPPGQWLPVDAYYPARRLVLLCGPLPAEVRAVCRTQIPARGLVLLELEPDELPDDEALLRAQIRRQIDELAPVPAPTAPPPPAPRPRPAADRSSEAREHVVRTTFASLITPTAAPLQARRTSSAQTAAAQRAARLLESRRAAARPGPAAIRSNMPPTPAAIARRRSLTRGHAAVQAPRLEGSSLVIALALLVVICLEAYVGVVAIGLGHGNPLLALALLLDACARMAGATAALRLGEPGWTWGCAVGGSPAVAAFALFQGSGPITAEPAPLAGLLSVLALALAGVAALTRLAGL